MQLRLLILLAAAVVLSGCLSTDPALTNGEVGNLEVRVTAPQAVNTHAARIYIDGVFIGNVSERLPILYLKRGKHSIRVELAGTKPYQQSILILGDPNHQVLNVVLEQ